MKLAGAPPPPPGLTIDGVDLGPVLFQGDDTAHDCITFYNYPHAATAKEVINLSAMRCGDHKVYWWVAGAPPAGVKPGPQPEGKPLVFNLAKDPSEDSPLDSSTADYAQAVKTAEAARVAHLKTIEIVSDLVHSLTFPVRESDRMRLLEMCCRCRIRWRAATTPTSRSAVLLTPRRNIRRGRTAA